MAVVSVTQKSEGRVYQHDGDSRTATRLFVGKTDSNTTTEKQLMDHADTPNVGDLYPSDQFLRVVDVSAAQAGGPRGWEITVNYSTEAPAEGDETNINPLLRPPQVSLAVAVSMEPVNQLDDGTTITVLANSAGIPYDPPLEREVNDMVISVTQNVSTFVPAFLRDYRGSVNSVEWETFNPGTCRIINLTYDRVDDADQTYWRRNVEIHVRADGKDYSYPTNYPWQKVKLNAGYQQYTTVGNAYEAITDDNGAQVTEPVYLDAAGRELLIGESPTYKRYDFYPFKDFSDLNIVLQ